MNSAITQEADLLSGLRDGTYHLVILTPEDTGLWENVIRKNLPDSNPSAVYQHLVALFPIIDI